MQVREDWSNVITPMAPSYDTSNRALHALSTVSERFLRVSLTELQIDLAMSSEIYLRMCVCRSALWWKLVAFIRCRRVG